MLKKLVCLVVAFLVLATSTSAHAAMTAFMRVKNHSGQLIAGSVTQKGREGASSIISTSHEMVSPRDPASGLATGKRMHKPFNVTMELDKAVPLLLKAMVTNENLTEVTVQYYRPSTGGLGAAGVEQQFYTVKLTNATIASVRFVQPNTVTPDLHTMPETVEIAFVYQKISWTWTEGNVSTEDSWASPT